MSYEEISKSAYGNDVFTNGAEGRYTKPKSPTEKNGEKKKRAPKIPPTTTDDPNEHPYENENPDEVVKTKKKSRKTHENGETQNGEEAALAVPSADGETVVKTKKKRAPKVESNNESIDPIPTTTADEEPVKKKKSKTPKSTTIEEDSQMIENLTINELDPTIETTTKVKKSKKHKAPKIPTDPTADTFNDVHTNNFDEYSTNQEFNDAYTDNGAYGSTLGDMSYDASLAYPTETEQIASEPTKSDYESEIINAYNDLQSKINFTEFVGNDQWSIIHLPKGARAEPRSRIRKILPGGKDDKPNGKLPGEKPTQRSRFLNRIRSGVGALVRDENNLIFGEQSMYELSMYQDEDEDIDTDDLHRYAQKLRELEDTDREVNPEFLVLRDGKTVYAVHEADNEGKMKYSTRKPIYDRYVDQGPDDEPTEKKKLLSRLKNPFNRNKDKDSKDINSPKLSNGTPDPSGKRRSRKSANKNADDDMATVGNSEPLVD